MKRTSRQRPLMTSLRTALFLASAAVALTGASSAGFVKVTPLVTNDQTAHSAQISDPNLVNAWGMSYGPTSPLWISDNGSGVSTLYHVDPVTNATTKVGLTVTIPGDGSVSGQAFNSGAASGAFNGDNFLFVNEDGTVSGWRGALGTTAETLQAGSTSNVYKGTALVTMGGHSYLFGANFGTGNVDVIKGDAGAPNLTGAFNDPTLPANYAPFDVQNLGGHIFVSYAEQTPGSKDEMDGLGLGLVDEYDTNGNLLARVGTGGTLDAPWGMAIAPTSFGPMAGDLLVGNFGDGTINIYNTSTDKYLGQLAGDAGGTPLSIDGLWGLIPGNGGAGGNPNDIYFSAGPDGESNGLFGALAAVPEPSTWAMMILGFGLIGFSLRSARSKSTGLV